MNDATLDAGNINRYTRELLGGALEQLPELESGAVLDLAGISTLLSSLNSILYAASDARVASTLSDALTTGYNAIRDGLTALNTTLETEFEAI